MNHSQPSVRLITLPQSQAVILLKLLERLSATSGEQNQILDDVCQKLSDALWLARWLRKSVSWDLSGDDLINISQALAHAIEQDDWCDDEYFAIREVAGQLDLPLTPPQTTCRDASMRTCAIKQHAT